MKILAIGTGQAFKDKMVPAIKKMGGAIEVEAIIDTLSEDEVKARLKEDFNNFTYFQTDGTQEELSRILEELDGSIDAVIDTSPNKFHVPYLEVALTHGLKSVSERAPAISRKEIAKVRQLLNRYSNISAYTPEYYRDEKGLAFRVLTGEINEDSSYAQFLEGDVRKLSGQLNKIGEIKNIEGKVLESKGKAGSITHRLWVGDKDQGGIIMDMFSHFVIYPIMLNSHIGDLDFISCKTGICNQISEEYKGITGKNIAETYVKAVLVSKNGCKIVGEVGKYTGEHVRYIDIIGERGEVHLDFETQKLTLESIGLNGEVIAISEPKYRVIMEDIKNRFSSSKPNHYGFDTSLKATELILVARQEAKKDKPFFYDSSYK